MPDTVASERCGITDLGRDVELGPSPQASLIRTHISRGRRPILGAVLGGTLGRCHFGGDVGILVWQVPWVVFGGYRSIFRVVMM